MTDTNPTEEWDSKYGTIVFVLGAGCSVDCGAPTMKDFMRTAREYERRLKNDDPRKQDYAALFKFREDCLRVSYVFDRWWENIEHLFTQAHLRKLTKDEKADELCNQITRAIWDVYRRPRAKPDTAAAYGAFSNYLYRICDRFPRAPRPVVVTTNYDLHLEASVLREVQKPGGSQARIRWGAVCYPGDPGDPLATADFLRIEKLTEWLSQPTDRSSRSDPGLEVWPLEIAKLHGSVNWFCKNQDAKPYVEARPDGQAAPFLCQTDGYRIPSDETPLIVPPLLGKADLPDLITEQWRRAVHAVKWARLIVVIGYSFPETDTFMSRLLAEGIRDNRGLERFVIINPAVANDEWLASVERMFARSWWQNSVDLQRETFEKFVPHLRRRESDANNTISLLLTFAGLGE